MPTQKSRAQVGAAAGGSAARDVGRLDKGFTTLWCEICAAFIGASACLKGVVWYVAELDGGSTLDQKSAGCALTTESEKPNLRCFSSGKNPAST
jgi:hypothetical protein